MSSVTRTSSNADANLTASIYRMIAEQKYKDVIEILKLKAASRRSSRSLLSLLGWCYFQLSDFVSAADCYERLTELCPTIHEYWLYFAQCLLYAGFPDEANKVLDKIANDILAAKSGDKPNSKTPLELQQNYWRLRASVKYHQNETAECRAALEQCDAGDPRTQANEACILYQSGQYKAASQKLQEVEGVMGFSPRLAYAAAVTHYRSKNYRAALNLTNEITKNGIEKHPELVIKNKGIGMKTEGIDIRSVAQMPGLRSSFLIETFNLRGAIEYLCYNAESAKECLTDMPPRAEAELDTVTLHNRALFHFDEEPGVALQRLETLLTDGVNFPPEAFANLILIYCRFGQYEVAADILAENIELSYTCLTPFLYDYIEAVLVQQVSSEEAYVRFDQLAQSLTNDLRIISKQIKELRSSRPSHPILQHSQISRQSQVSDEDDDDKPLAARRTSSTSLQQVRQSGPVTEPVKALMGEYDEILARYVSVAMAQAKLYWGAKNYVQVERLLRTSFEFCAENESWKVNMAHAQFLQEKYTEAAQLYEDIMSGSLQGTNNNTTSSVVFNSQASSPANDILNINPVLLANLCVSYIMTSRTEDAEELLRSIEEAEENRLLTQLENEANTGQNVTPAEGAAWQFGAGDGGSTSVLNATSSMIDRMSSVAGARLQSAAAGQSGTKMFHLCIVNLIIGTLYCSKNNFDFGITRILRSFEPHLSAKLGPDTWFYAKRCLLALLDKMHAHVVTLREEVIVDTLKFFNKIEEKGQTIAANNNAFTDSRNAGMMIGRNAVAYEARILKWLLMKYHYTM